MNNQDININDLYNMEVGQLRELVNNSVRLANQQISDLETSGYAKISQAYRTLALRQGRENPSFSIANDDLNKAQLVNKYISTQSYLKLKTSSVSGTRDVNEQILRESGATEEQINDFFDEVEGKKSKTEDKKSSESSGGAYRNMSEFWRIYSKIREMRKDLIASLGSLRVQQLLMEVLNDDENLGEEDIEEIINRIVEKAQEDYEEQMEEEYEADDDIWQDL